MTTYEDVERAVEDVDFAEVGMSYDRSRLKAWRTYAMFLEEQHELCKRAEGSFDLIYKAKALVAKELQ